MSFVNYNLGGGLRRYLNLGKLPGMFESIMAKPLAKVSSEI